MKNISEVINNAERWIKSLEISEENRALRELGLLFCDSIHKKEMLLTTEKTNDIHDIITSPADLINLTRDELIHLTQQIEFSNTENWRIDKTTQETWSQFLSGLVLSYAKEGDLSIVAILIRMGVTLNLHGEWLEEAANFLIVQQQPEGYFGLFFEEIRNMEQEQKNMFLLRLTVDILWALAVKNTRLQNRELIEGNF